ncbi:TonB-dependent receptor domain-containing protein [Hyphobacterium marinum]|uniref:TonB-dependent receptor n=1 Tax=Hyphobacterium marinum TaxID=3116574 RepID=A0ABU7LY44_9PROT|nr:TonB-dependent receptor [Hyphobacterium sp. Y6023]MEE2566207.1 TonB-dependent receptor [Hyphobacterium sp. Y6023]
MTQRNVWVWAASTLVLAQLATGLAYGQDADTELEEAERDVVIVSATRTEIPAFDYPGMASVIDAETIELTDPSTLDELLREVPGVEVSGGPRRTGQTITLRGQSRENVTILLDGARQNFNSAHDGVAFVDPALIVGVDVVRGPASALYGSGASGGVIALRTANADDLLSDDASGGLRATLGGRSVDGEIRAGLTVFGRSGALQGLAHLSSRESGDIRLGSGNDLPADDSSLSGLFKVGAELSPGVTGEVSWQTIRADATEPNNGQGNAGVGGLNPLVNKDITSDTVQLRAQIAPASSRWLDLDITLFNTQSGVEETETVGGRIVDRQLDSWGVRADQRFEFALGAMDAGLTVGGEMYEDEQTGFDSAAAGGVRGGVPNASTSFQGVFAQLELTGAAPFGLPGEFVLLPGVRFDNYESETTGIASNEDSQTSGRFGVSYAPNDTFLLFTNWAQAFRAPSVNEIYLDGTHFSLPHPILGAPVFITNEFIANPNLRPENTETIEAGFGLNFRDMARDGDRLEIKASVFETQAEDLINLFVNFAFDPTCFAPPTFLPCSAGTTNSANVADATLQGFEILADYRSGPFSLSASLSETDGSDDATGAPVGALTPLRLFVDARWRMDAQRLTLGARGEFAGEFDKTATPAQERDGYTVVDLYASWRPIADRGLTLNAAVNNIFDEDYERVFAGVSEAGRGVRADITWSTEW